MNIYKIELKQNRKSLIFWCVGMLFMIAAGMSKFSAFEGTGTDVNEIFKSMPKSVTTVLGLGDFDLTKAIGFYCIMYLYLIIMATIHATLLGANIIAKEERDKTAEFLYTKPLTRTDIITSKYLAALTNITILNLVTLIVSIVVVNQYGQTDNGLILTLMFSMFVLQLIFLTLGTAMAAILRNPKRAASLATGILLITFILSIIVDLGKNLNFLNYLTPFKYFAAKTIYDNGIPFISILLSVLLIGVFIYLTYTHYKKRDLMV